MSNYSTAPAQTIELLTLLEPQNAIDTVFSWRVIEPPCNKGFIPTPARPRNVRGTFGQVNAQLSAANVTHRAAVYLMIQANDSKGFGKANVERIRALFVDLDEDGPAKLEAVMQGVHAPHLVVESSPGKYHCYWQASLPVEHYEGRSKQLIDKYGGDPSCFDLARILRVPGFYHHKAEPFLSSVIHRAAEPVPLTQDNLTAWLGSAPPPVPICKPSGPPEKRHPNNLVPWFQVAGMYLGEVSTGRHNVICPWVHRHTDGDQSGTVYFEPTEANWFSGGFKCQHAHCQDKRIKNARSAVHRLAAWKSGIRFEVLYDRFERGLL
ncbi:hypothetical protein FV139_00550 [Parahaliea maris]|uniref:RepB-like DNA primase domain-containing protein n=1 Tax=Parahaliea maris TaxID=2716870 RepID=A0A5C9A9S8_9GAMM|nr:DNA-primase RepB domain-containing protein [Parahaliea maris]TXS96031.1 hypothetical protein FV139_00550 [Parahaliea maris]